MTIIHDSRPPEKKPLSPQTILARIFVGLILVSLFFAIFVLPWLFG